MKHQRAHLRDYHRGAFPLRHCSWLKVVRSRSDRALAVGQESQLVAICVDTESGSVSHCEGTRGKQVWLASWAVSYPS